MFLTRPKKCWFLLIASCLLFLVSACGSSPSSQQTPTPIVSTSTPVAPTSTPLPSTSVPTTQVLTSSCPVHNVVMPALPAGSHPNVVYLSEQGGTQTVMTHAQLIRYDTFTKQKTTILSLSPTNEEISQAQISADGQWILFLVDSYTGTQTTLQLIRVDGQMQQTLFCSPAYKIGGIQWSPDGRQVAFTATGANNVPHIQVLDLTTNHQEAFQANGYNPYSWLNNTQLYIIQTQGSQSSTTLNLALLDTSKGTLTPIASTNPLCGAFEKSSDGTQLLASSCTPTAANNCRGPVMAEGPSTLSVLPAAGGPARTIYHNQNLAIRALDPVNSQTLLMYIENTGGDLSQNGLWKINADGSGLTRLTTATGEQCEDLEFPVLYPHIVSNGSYYALQVADTGTLNDSLLVGNLNGGAPTTFETKSIDGVLILVGMANLS